MSPGGAPAAKRVLAAAVSAAVCAATVPAAVRAQEPDTLIPLPPVIVVSFPLPTDLAGAPAAVTVIDGAGALRARPGIGLGALLDPVPGVQLDDRHNDALDDRIAIRGFGARAQFGVRGLAVLVDGVPATMPDGQTALSHLDPSAVRSAEVVRGPASTFAGNAGGGALRIATAPTEETLQARVVAGSDGLLRLEAAAARRVGRALVSGRLARRRSDGYRAHADADRTWAAAHVEAPVGPGRMRVALHGVDYEARNPGSLSDSTFHADPRAAFERNVEQRTGETGRQAQLGVGWAGSSGQGDWDVSAWTLSRDIDNPIPVVIVDLERLAAGVRLRYRSPAEGFAWAAGVDLAGQRDRRRNLENLGGERGDAILDQRERVTSAAPLAQVSADAGPFRLSAAARWDIVRFDVDDRLGVSATDGDGDRTLSALSPALGVAWRARPGLHAFANLSTAFETPTASELANDPDGGGFNAALEPQRTVGLELGARGVRPGARWEAVVHHARVEDALVPFEGDAGRTFFRNAGRTRHAGVELAAAVEVGRGVTARASYSWTRVDFRRFAPAGTELRGNAVPGVTPHRAEAALAVRAGDAFAEAALRYRSRTAADDANAASWPAHAVLDVRFEGPAVEWRGTALRAQAGILNVADEAYAGSIVPNAFGGRYFEPAPGRTLYAGVEVVGRPRG